MGDYLRPLTADVRDVLLAASPLGSCVGSVPRSDTGFPTGSGNPEGKSEPSDHTQRSPVADAFKDVHMGRDTGEERVFLDPLPAVGG